MKIKKSELRELINEIVTEDKAYATDYDNAFKEMQSEIKKLNKILAGHKKKFNKEGSINWGYIGDLKKLISDMKDMTSGMKV
jgi:DNA repair exonuclease SbcCD ATPase subunit